MNKLTKRSGALAAALLLAGCTIGPDYHQPKVELPTGFKEGANWQRSAANPQGALDSQWWLVFNDPQLTHLVEQSLKANQSIVAAEAAYRFAQAEVDADRSSLFPTVSADISGSRSKTNSASGSTIGAVANGGIRNSTSASLAASWEPDLWGGIRRQIESGKENLQATDAQLAGERLSIAASVATDYLALRQDDIDVDLLEKQQRVDVRLLDLTRASYQQGIASNDTLLIAEDTLESVIANLQTSKIAREQEEHAIAVLIGVPPANFSIAPQPSYTYAAPDIPLVIPSVLLERRPDVVVAERTAASANARIGVAKAAFFPTLNLSAQGGFEANTLAHLFTLPSRVWTLGPDLAATVLDGGARTAAVHEAEATYDQDAADYRQAVLTAFQNVEDSLSSVNHLNDQARAFQNVYQRNVLLFNSEQAQLSAGTASEQNLLTQQLTLLTAEQGQRDAQGQVAQNEVLLIKNLGGGWSGEQTSVGSVGSVTESASTQPASASTAK
ncbi:efflux transporter outer membrane subunit [Burkholderia sp. L27(2015)]|uniref:efflux transporter outer membrane subunit n=1 Tax=Burkholderia sp. L27(2015) TaxID=1641858 RepID=UPI00157661CF|nr:efflux transporter outer membrane subunit [Burkholderia sp. L27(2015)]